MLPQASLRTAPVAHPYLNSAPRLPSTSGGFGSLELMGSQMTFGPNEEIFGENEPAERVYKVTKGAVRTYKILCDGRRQIGAFYFPGDIFGLEIGKEHQFSAEAIDKVTVLVIRSGAVVSLAERDSKAARELWAFTARELHRVREHMMLMVKSAHQRVACFLLEMSERLSDGEAIKLPMSRQDIADYLGLTIETVSRTLTQLVSDRTIGLPSSRRIVLRNRSVLHELNS
jgi:CRP/FNR family transcriptional regulator, nitrogen fixation regulation protein